jgi:hypothetical protein
MEKSFRMILEEWKKNSSLTFFDPLVRLLCFAVGGAATISARSLTFSLLRTNIGINKELNEQ